MNRDQIKLLAVIAMTLNHVAFVFLPKGTVLYEVFVDVGYLTAVTMLYFLAEGYRRTSSVRNYALRLLVFALFAQVPFSVLFGLKEGGNMLLTLLTCLIILAVMDRVENPAVRIPVALGLALLTYFSDWGIFAPVAAVLFYLARGERRAVARSYGLLSLIQFAMHFSELGKKAMEGSGTLAEAALLSLCASLPIFVSACLILFCYSGKRTVRFAGAAKWFFYLYYPAHLVVLWLIRRFAF